LQKIQNIDWGRRMGKLSQHTSGCLKITTSISLKRAIASLVTSYNLLFSLFSARQNNTKTYSGTEVELQALLTSEIYQEK
jgi:hypothetical protein